MTDETNIVFNATQENITGQDEYEIPEFLRKRC